MEAKDIPIKQDGDELSAEEFNAVTDSIVIESELATTVAMGGIPANTILKGKNVKQVLTDILFPEQFQAASGIVAPSLTFTISASGLPGNMLVKVGTSLNILKNRNFSRGSISPQYQSESPFRSGALIDYTETGSDGNQVITLGNHDWTCRANYAAGVQPKGSNGTAHPNYTALPAGSTLTTTRTIYGVLPVYSTSSNIANVNELTLQSHNTDIITSMVTESGASKQVFKIPVQWKSNWNGVLTGLWQQNPLNPADWTTIPTTSFTLSPETESITINGSSYDYYVYTHNGVTTGPRTLKIKA